MFLCLRLPNLWICCRNFFNLYLERCLQFAIMIFCNKLLKIYSTKLALWWKCTSRQKTGAIIWKLPGWRCFSSIEPVLIVLFFPPMVISYFSYFSPFKKCMTLTSWKGIKWCCSLGSLLLITGSNNSEGIHQIRTKFYGNGTKMSKHNDKLWSKSDTWSYSCRNVISIFLRYNYRLIQYPWDMNWTMNIILQ